MSKSYEMNMTSGPILKKLIIYAIPLIITNMLQLLFNAADVAVLGILVNDNAVAAVGASGSLINLVTSMFIGLASGVQVVLSRRVGAEDVKGSHRLVGTALVTGLLGGLILVAIGVPFARQFLIWMNCAPSVLDGATIYLVIYFLGMPIMMLYNFIASILRAVGDTFRPMLYLLIGGVANIILNVFFIVVCNLTVEGVAIATISSQAIALVLSIIALVKSSGYSKLNVKDLKIRKQEFIDIAKVGLPAGLQSSLFSISNVLIQSTINSFGDLTMTANTIASQFDGFVYQAGHSVALACMAFVGQNLGACDIPRVRKVIKQSIYVVAVFAFALGVLMALCSDILCSIMTNDAEIIEYAKIRLYIVGAPYFLCGIMEVLSYSLRALGRATTSMFISLFWGCVFRVIWLSTFYLLNPTREMVYFSYPISWIFAIITFLIVLSPILKHLSKELSRKDNTANDNSQSDKNDSNEQLSRV